MTVTARLIQLRQAVRNAGTLPPIETCATCKHAVLSMYVTEDDSSAVELQCRRYPPTVILDNGEPDTVWPVMVATDCCSEHRRR